MSPEDRSPSGPPPGPPTPGLAPRRPARVDGVARGRPALAAGVRAPRRRRRHGRRGSGRGVAPARPGNRVGRLLPDLRPPGPGSTRRRAAVRPGEPPRRPLPPGRSPDRSPPARPPGVTASGASRLPDHLSESYGLPESIGRALIECTDRDPMTVVAACPPGNDHFTTIGGPRWLLSSPTMSGWDRSVSRARPRTRSCSSSSKPTWAFTPSWSCS